MRASSRLIALNLISFLSIFGNRADAQDYSAYNIVKTYLGEKNYLLAYKYMIIFKYSNIERLQKKENAAVLNGVESKMAICNSFKMAKRY
jgi:hypothetical protein